MAALSDDSTEQNQTLVPRYFTAGFRITERGIIRAAEWSEFNTSWAKRLRHNERRVLTYLIARAI